MNQQDLLQKALETADLIAGGGDLKKRLDDLENTPASKTSLDGQEELADEKKGKGHGSLFKGLL